MSIIHNATANKKKMRANFESSSKKIFWNLFLFGFAVSISTQHFAIAQWRGFSSNEPCEVARSSSDAMLNYPKRLSMSMLLRCFRVARFEVTEDVEFRIQLLSKCRKSTDWWKKNVIHSHLIGNVSIMSRTWYFVMSFCIRSSLNKLFDFLHVDHQQGQILLNLWDELVQCHCSYVTSSSFLETL